LVQKESHEKKLNAGGVSMTVRDLRFSLAALALIGALPAPGADRSDPDQDRAQQSRYDDIVNAFIAYDIGQLRGQEGAMAARRFAELKGDEAIPALVRGVNRAARMHQSCPIIVLARKLQSLLGSSSSLEMVTYAAENLDGSGHGVVYASYVERLRQSARQKLGRDDLRVQRKLRAGTTSQLLRANKPVAEWTFEDLQEAIYQEKGSGLVEVLEELSCKRRKGAQYTATLAQAIAVVPDDAKEVARALLAQRLRRMTDRTLLAKLEDPNVEVRTAAVRAIGYKRSPLYAELAAAMRDKPMVAEYAHQVLVKLSGEDFGPGPKATGMDWYRASKRWEEWAERQEASEEEREREGEED
jgi:hypothetical protein